MKRKWLILITSVIGLIGTVCGVICAQQDTEVEKSKRLTAQTSLHRAETELDLQCIETEQSDETQNELDKLNAEVQDAVCYPDLIDAINSAITP